MADEGFDILGTQQVQLSAIIGQSPISIAVFDRKMRYLAASRLWLERFGLGERDVMGRVHYDLVPDISERWKDIHRRALAGETLRSDGDPDHADGRTRWKSWEAGPWHRTDGEIGGIVIRSRDVTARVEAQQKLAIEVDALARLNEASSRLWRTQDLKEGLSEMLSATIELLGAEKGVVQLWQAERNVLVIAAQRGFKQDFLATFREVSIDDHRASSRALRTGKIVVIEDIEQDEPLRPLRPIARAEDFRAVVSGPMLDQSGACLGVLSAHFRSPHQPNDFELQRLSLYLRQAANFVERCTSEKAARQNEERLRLAVKASRMAMWDWNVRTGHATWNDELYHMLGYGVGEVEPSYAAWIARVHSDDVASTEAALAVAMREQGDYTNEHRILRPDGTVHWGAGYGKFLYDDKGKPVRMLGLMVDATEARRHEDQQRVLVAELQHRTRNLMAVVQSIAHRTAATAQSLEDFENRFEGRLAALSRVQNLLSRASGERITLDGLIGMELEALSPDAVRDRVTVAGPEVRVRNASVQMLSLAIHELATNALKYGALAGENGHLSVTWQINSGKPGRCVALEWAEHGIAATQATGNPAHRGYGRMLIEQALPYTLSARTSYELGVEALHCSIVLPFTADDMVGAIG